MHGRSLFSYRACQPPHASPYRKSPHHPLLADGYSHTRPETSATLCRPLPIAPSGVIPHRAPLQTAVFRLVNHRYEVTEVSAPPYSSRLASTPSGFEFWLLLSKSSGQDFPV